ncbi:MAG: HAMP domain-containing histidine kinase [Candidatus Kapabacteria bacterium]|nr:HAMP domain-containing histidine kinase [Ignavibacteriota bacterium]MCW5884753.1 HAMP domain-containing histidine kinase [Candidatus Kapabacteria bacterium]
MLKLKISMFGKMIIFSSMIEIFLLLIVFLSLYSFRLNDKKQNLLDLEKTLNNCKNMRLELLLRRDSDFIEIYNNNISQINVNLEIYDSISKELSSIDELFSLDSLKKFYKDLIKEYDVLFREFGLSEDTGIEGKFRDKIHKLEEFLRNNNDDRLLFFLLQARRREKDYIMRGREEYADQVHHLINRFVEEVEKSKMTKSNKVEFISLAKDYDKSFAEFVIIFEKLSELEQQMSLIENDIEKLITNLVISESEVIDNFVMSLVPIFAISIFVSIILSVLIARSITKPLIHLKDATIKVADGDLSYKVKIESNDEIGEVARFFNIMTEKIAKANDTIVNQQNKLNEQYSELKEINATRDKFFSIIAHDLKNPISAFMGVSAFLVKTFQDLSREEIKEFLDGVNNTAKRLFELLENLLLWSRTQRGLIQYHPMNLELTQILQHNLELLNAAAVSKSINLSGEIESDIDVYADPNMLNTILRNLITNAIKFTKENGNVIVRTKQIGDYCRISIIDDGVGISKELISGLFKLEGSVSTVGTNQESGTGLGLIICKEFVEKHSGEIWVDSKLGEGSAFHFTIPIAFK